VIAVAQQICTLEFKSFRGDERGIHLNRVLVPLSLPVRLRVGVRYFHTIEAFARAPTAGIINHFVAQGGVSEVRFAIRSGTQT